MTLPAGPRVTLLVVAKGLGRGEGRGALVARVPRPLRVVRALSVEIQLGLGLAHLCGRKTITIQSGE